MRDSDEVVILPLPGAITDMIAAADAYLDQYGVVAQLAVRGTVKLEGGQLATIPAFRTIARFDRDLGLIGFGDLDEADEALLWAYPQAGFQARALSTHLDPDGPICYTLEK